MTAHARVFAHILARAFVEVVLGKNKRGKVYPVLTAILSQQWMEIGFNIHKGGGTLMKTLWK